MYWVTVCRRIWVLEFDGGGSVSKIALVRGSE